MNQYLKPDFFIVGAPKCGTTSMYHYLRQHDQIFMPDYKEPHYFGKDLKKRSDEFVDNEDEYLNLFKECALLNCGVQYTPDGNYSTFEDGVMTAYQITLGLQELEPVFSNDYGSNSEICY